MTILRSVANLGVTTYLTQDYKAGTDTTITVFDASQLPSAPGSVCIASLNNTDSVIVSYTAISGNTVTISGVTHASSTAAATEKYLKGCNVFKEFSDSIGGGGGGGGTTDYTSLQNKPKINNIELVGNRTIAEFNPKWSDIGGDISGNTALQTALDNKITKSSTSVTCTYGVDSDGKPFVEY